MRFRGCYPAKQYIDSAPARTRARFLALVRQLADRGKIVNRAHGHFLENPFSEIFELKPHEGRVLGFFSERNFYVAHGTKKKKRKAQIADYQVAEQLRQDFIRRLAKVKRGRHI